MSAVDGGSSRKEDRERASVWSDWGILVIPAGCLACCWVIFIWACGRGFSFRDDAFYLLWAAEAFSYKLSVTEFAYVWHPLYLAVGGNIALYRLGGAVVLGLCGLIFGTAVAQFVKERADSRVVRSIILVALVTSAFWEFANWFPTPNYNELNLCALLLLFAGILFASRVESASDNLLFEIVAPSMLVGAGFAVVVLGKPTTSATIVLLALGWVVFVRPRRPLLCIAIAAVTATLVLWIAILAIDGDLTVFIHRKLGAFVLLLTKSNGQDVHGIWGSIAGPFLPGRRWKLFPAVTFSAVIFLICAASFAVALLPSKLGIRSRRVLGYCLALLLGLTVAIWRAKDFEGPEILPAYHAWYFGLLIILSALIAVILVRGLVDLGGALERRWIVAATLLAFVPLAYSIGTDNTLILHMTAAGVFWTSSAVLLAALIPARLVMSALQTIGTNVGTATLGCLLGTMTAPSQASLPMWKEVVPITLGPQHAYLKVDEWTAAYISSMKRAAIRDGFSAGTPIIDLSGVGPGLVFALNGTASGVPWLASDAVDTRKYSEAVLRTIPRAELDRSWIITAPGMPNMRYTTILEPIGLDFPSGYARVAEAKRSDLGWSQILWKPRMRQRLPN